MFKRIALILVAISLPISGCSFNTEAKIVSTVVKPIDETLYSVDQVIEDLEHFKLLYVENNLSMQDDITKGEFFYYYDKLVKSIDKPMTAKDLYFEVSKLAAILGDAHSRITYSNEIYFFPNKLKWLAEGLVVAEKNEVSDLEVGDKILALNGKTTEEILEECEDIISVENKDRLKFAISNKILGKYMLDYLGCVNSNNIVPVKVEKPNGDIIEYSIDFVERELPEQDAIFIPLKDRPSGISYEILAEYDTGIIVIPKCMFNEEVSNYFKEFFTEVKENNISKIIVDLRNNSGGQTQIIGEFLKYIDCDKVQYWKNQKIDFGVKTIEHEGIDVFRGEIYIATTSASFSSAVMFTSTLKYNNLAKTIGEPTGNSTIFYGGTNPAAKTVLPNSKLKISTTRLKVYLQNDQYPPTIDPDIYLPLTVDNIVNGTDPIKEWIMQSEK